ncbi:translation initiation factor IF-2-like [Cervus canadensis]|uniref:translation initiation factor IF-2-like n=1 Tax=Cervus canadensis TaxID=1574408 RepID=UPI001C9E76ED|nr:translation initiation factor IF-2-like [Cervus canadensis]
MPPARARGCYFVPRPRRRARRARGAAALPRLSGGGSPEAGQAQGRQHESPAEPFARRRLPPWRKGGAQAGRHSPPCSTRAGGRGGASETTPGRPRAREAPAARCLPGPAAARGAWTGRSPRLLLPRLGVRPLGAAPRLGPVLGALPSARSGLGGRLCPADSSGGGGGGGGGVRAPPSPWKPLTLSALPPPPSSPQTTTPPPTSPPPRSRSRTGSGGSRLHSPRRRRRRLRKRPGCAPPDPDAPGSRQPGCPPELTGGGGGGGGAWQVSAQFSLSPTTHPPSPPPAKCTAPLLSPGAMQLGL